MLKKILGLFSLIAMAVLYILNVKPKKDSDIMAKKTIGSFSKLDAATQYDVCKSIDSKLH